MTPHSSPFSMESADEDEPHLAVIRKHLFGLISLYVLAFIGLAAAAALVYFLLPSLVGEDNFRANQLVALGGLIAVGLTIFFLFIATWVYRQSVLILTTKNVTQVIQRGLVSRKVSQLSLHDVQDVTSDQHGIFATVLNFGTLRIETAGEQVNFMFDYCPKPNYYAELIRETREKLDEIRPDPSNP